MPRPEPVISISAIEHHEYCPRQCALIHVDGVWVENRHTVNGQRFHRRVDTEGTSIERGRTVLRNVPLWSTRLGLSGRSDAIEVFGDGRIVPVEYKSGVRHGQTADLQLCAQALCLEEMLGVDVPVGFLWFGGTRRRVQVNLDRALRRSVVHVIQEIRAAFTATVLPSAAADERCEQCQLSPHCMPATVATDPVRLATAVRKELYRCDS